MRAGQVKVLYFSQQMPVMTLAETIGDDFDVLFVIELEEGGLEAFFAPAASDINLVSPQILFRDEHRR